MSQKKTSVKVPADLLEGVRKFHEVRESVNTQVITLNTEHAELQRRMVREQKRLDGIFSAAVQAIRDALLGAKIITENQIFIINTEFLEDHNEALIVIEPDGEPEPQRVLH